MFIRYRQASMGISKMTVSIKSSQNQYGHFKWIHNNALLVLPWFLLILGCFFSCVTRRVRKRRKPCQWIFPIHWPGRKGKQTRANEPSQYYINSPSKLLDDHPINKSDYRRDEHDSLENLFSKFLSLVVHVCRN
uniref:Uncharacterized protein n=1 Tax=Anguilla anguilla TaxID=7936 RepID=A0A0E9WGC9_ANGAN